MVHFKMAADSSQVDNTRVKGSTVTKSILYGNISQYFGKKRDSDGHTHFWTIYVKPFAANEDLSIYIRKVDFKLHDSYANSTRVVAKPPFEVSESGWGEFEITIKIHFVDPTERPVTLYHLLKLFQTEPVVQQQQQQIVTPKKHLVSEFYDEIVFQSPTKMMYQLLSRKSDSGIQETPSWVERENLTTEKISAARRRVAEEIAKANRKLKGQKNAIHALRDEIVKLEKGLSSGELKPKDNMSSKALPLAAANPVKVEPIV